MASRAVESDKLFGDGFCSEPTGCIVVLKVSIIHTVKAKSRAIF